MIINPNGSDHVYELCTQIEGVHNENYEALHKYVHMAMDTWCDANDAMVFSVRHLFGGGNYDWNSSPLHSITKHFFAKDDPDPIRAASQSIGWILKNVARSSPRTFMLYVLSTPMYPDVNHYAWQCDEDRQWSELIGVEIR